VGKILWRKPSNSIASTEDEDETDTALDLEDKECS